MHKSDPDKIVLQGNDNSSSRNFAHSWRSEIIVKHAKAHRTQK